MGSPHRAGAAEEEEEMPETGWDAADRSGQGGANGIGPIEHSVSTHTIRGFMLWQDFVHENFPWLEMRNLEGREFHAEVGSCSFGDSALSTISADPSEVHRTKRLAEAAEEGFIKLMWQMAGQLELEQDGRRCVISAGQATVCDTARPYKIKLSRNSRFTVLVLPYGACSGWERISQRLCGSPLRDATTARAALGALMALTGSGGSARPGSNATALRAIHWMLSSSLHQSATTMKGSGMDGEARLSKAQGYVLQNIGNPGLDAADLARVLCMSRRALYMLFEAYHLTPRNMIRNIRLQECRRILSDPSQRHRKIIDVAVEHGFKDPATFSRQFKARYDVSPSQMQVGRV